MFCPTCDRAVGYVSDVTSAVMFLHVVFSPDGKGFCKHCEAPLDIDLMRQNP